MEGQIIVRQHISITIHMNWFEFTNSYHLFPIKVCLHNEGTNIDQKKKKKYQNISLCKLKYVFLLFVKPFNQILNFYTLA